MCFRWASAASWAWTKGRLILRHNSGFLLWISSPVGDRNNSRINQEVELGKVLDTRHQRWGSSIETLVLFGCSAGGTHEMNTRRPSISPDPQPSNSARFGTFIFHSSTPLDFGSFRVNAGIETSTSVDDTLKQVPSVWDLRFLMQRLNSANDTLTSQGGTAFRWTLHYHPDIPLGCPQLPVLRSAQNLGVP